MEMLLKRVEGCLDGTLAKAPVAAVNVIIDIKNVYFQSVDHTLTDSLFRPLETTGTPSKNSSLRLPRDSSPWIRPWTKVFPTLRSHE